MVEVEEEEEKEATGKREEEENGTQRSAAQFRVQLSSVRLSASWYRKLRKGRGSYALLRTVPRTLPYQPENPDIAISLFLSPSSRERREILSRPSGD